MSQPMKTKFRIWSTSKSNSNGTYFVLTLDNVNRNTVGYVDFDKIDGLKELLLPMLLPMLKLMKVLKFTNIDFS